MTPTARILYLDGWRGLAILLVLVGHFLPIPGSDAGRAGVELFFVLSGLLMSRLLLEKNVPLKRFFMRRLGRVLPALFGFLAVATLMQLLFAGVFGEFRLSDTGSVLFFYSNYNFLESRPGIFGHTWSLSIEEHSYVVLGAVAYLGSRNARIVAAFVGVLVLSMWFRGAVLTDSGLGYHEVYWRTDVRAASIFLGFSLYTFRPSLLRLLQGRAVGLAGTAMAVGAPLLLIRAVPSPIKYSLGTLCICLVLVWLESADTSPLRSVFEQRWLRWLGKHSFSIYLFQQIAHVAKVEVPAVLWPLLGGLSVAVGWISFKMIETPGQRVVDRITDGIRSGD